jgi:hypothetical protein
MQCGAGDDYFVNEEQAMEIPTGLGCDESANGKLASELTFWVRDNLPEWRDNDPYYALWKKAKELLDRTKA